MQQSIMWRIKEGYKILKWRRQRNVSRDGAIKWSGGYYLTIYNVTINYVENHEEK
jgi:hypothetical protein